MFKSQVLISSETSLFLCLPDFSLFASHLCLGQHPRGPKQPVPPLLPCSILLVAAVAGVDEVAPLGDALDEGGQGEQALQHRVEVARVPYVWESYLLWWHDERLPESGGRLE